MQNPMNRNRSLLHTRVFLSFCVVQLSPCYQFFLLSTAALINDGANIDQSGQI